MVLKKRQILTLIKLVEKEIPAISHDTPNKLIPKIKFLKELVLELNFILQDLESEKEKNKRGKRYRLDAKDAEIQKLRKALKDASDGIESALRLDEKIGEAWDDLSYISRDIKKATSSSRQRIQEMGKARQRMDERLRQNQKQIRTYGCCY